MGWVQVTLGVTLSNVTQQNNVLLNSYFESPIDELYALYFFNIYVNFHANRI